MARASVMTGEERRGLSLTDAHAELRGDGAEARFAGHACVFDVRTSIGNPLKWGFYEECAAGMFTKTLMEGDARFLLDHDSYYVVSRVSAGTLNLAQDRVGLAVDSVLDTDLSYVSDLKANIRNKNTTGMSFGFYVVKDDWTTEEITTSDGNTAEVEVRRILEVKLLEVSAVTFPAYEETDAGLRAALRSRGDIDAVRRRIEHKPDLESLLDELPFRRTTVIDLGEGNSVSTKQEAVVSDQDEPGETTRSDEQSTDDEVTEPGEPTQNAPSQIALAGVRLRQLKRRLR